MEFLSTRGKSKVNNASEAILKGLADDGGLFVPKTFPKIDLNDLLNLEYYEQSAFIISKYLEEFNYKELLTECKKAYSKFEDNEPAPVCKIDDDLFVLELFHGPTLAFKDIALTLLPYLLRKCADICGIKEQILILVATSGDTGKAALEGFKDAKGIKINVFYPEDGVSDMQKLQMRTQEGENVNVVAVNGNFDDCQTAVKNIFSNAEYVKLLKENGFILSSANSINFGRLVPQIVYYFSSYIDLVNSNEIKLGDKVNFVVPTGNFGDILAGYYAKLMGLPVNKLICASNSNNVLTEFFNSGEYNSKRDFIKTSSPSMDILISSNLERLVFESYNRDGKKVLESMQKLKSEGFYSIDKNILEFLKKEFYADFCDEEECFSSLENTFDELGYLPDTHTSIALAVQEKFKNYSKDKNKSIVLSTASPFKFAQSVYFALTGKKIKDAFIASEKISLETALSIPENITKLKTKEIRFNKSVDKTETFDAIKDFININ